MPTGFGIKSSLFQINCSFETCQKIYYFYEIIKFPGQTKHVSLLVNISHLYVHYELIR